MSPSDGESVRFEPGRAVQVLNVEGAGTVLATYNQNRDPVQGALLRPGGCNVLQRSG